MRNGQTLEADVVRVARRAGSRSVWKSLALMPHLFRISRKLDRLVKKLETSEERLSPSNVNRLSRSLHGVQGQLKSPMFRVIRVRIERSNLRLAGHAEGVYMSSNPDYTQMNGTVSLRLGPGSQGNGTVRTRPHFRSA